MLLVPFTGVLKDDNTIILKGKGGKRMAQNYQSPFTKRGTLGIDVDDPVLERDIYILLLKYIKSGVIFDIVANIPALFYTIEWAEHSKEVNSEYAERLFDDKVYVTFMALKVLRLFHFDKV